MLILRIAPHSLVHSVCRFSRSPWAWSSNLTTFPVDLISYTQPVDTAVGSVPFDGGKKLNGRPGFTVARLGGAAERSAELSPLGALVQPGSAPSPVRTRRWRDL